MSAKFLQIDEEGFPKFGELRIADPIIGSESLKNIRLSDLKTVTSTVHGESYIVEAFDEPFVAQQVEFNRTWKIILPYELEFDFNLETLTLDEWDRFHGFTQSGIPFVFSRKAQAEFFNSLEDYDDESITHKGVQYNVPPYWKDFSQAESEKFWTQIYQTENPRWNLGSPSPVLAHILPALKLPPSRILVPGAGFGHDAALLAQQGHFVTALDISPEAIIEGRKIYGEQPRLTFVEGDIFTLAKSGAEKFDIIFEHTCFCAINPSSRNKLVQAWRDLLVENGRLLGIFFTMEKRGHPPFGGSEWEIRERLKKGFRFLLWQRARSSVEKRLGKELLVFAEKKNLMS